MKSIALVVFAATQILSFSTLAADNELDMARTRDAAVQAALAGCVAAVVNPAVKGYMQRAAEVGKPFASEEAARVEMTGAVQWKRVIEPGIRAGCRCAMAKEVSVVMQAQYPKEIADIMSISQERLNDPDFAESRRKEFDRCFQVFMDKLNRTE